MKIETRGGQDYLLWRGHSLVLHPPSIDEKYFGATCEHMFDLKDMPSSMFMLADSKDLPENIYIRYHNKVAEYLNSDVRVILCNWSARMTFSVIWKLERNIGVESEENSVRSIFNRLRQNINNQYRIVENIAADIYMEKGVMEFRGYFHGHTAFNEIVAFFNSLVYGSVSATNVDQANSTLVEPQSIFTVESQSVSPSNSRTLVLTSAAVLEQAKSYLKDIERDNFICFAKPNQIELTKELIESLEGLIDVADTDEFMGSPDKAPELEERWRKIRSLILTDIRSRTSDEAIAEKAFPAGIILGCAGIGALLGGTVGFGAGAFVAKLILGEKKSTSVLDKVQEALDKNVGVEN